jgi:hypothetical protein
MNTYILLKIGKTRRCAPLNVLVRMLKFTAVPPLL